MLYKYDCLHIFDMLYYILSSFIRDFAAMARHTLLTLQVVFVIYSGEQNICFSNDNSDNIFY